MGEMDQNIGPKCIKHGGGSDFSSYFQKVDENGGSQPTFFFRKRFGIQIFETIKQILVDIPSNCTPVVVNSCGSWIILGEPFTLRIP